MGLKFFDQKLYETINKKVSDDTATEDEIRMYSNYIRPSNFYQNYSYSENFLREFKEDIDWQQVCMWTSPREEFVWEMVDFIYFNELLCNHPNEYSEDFYKRYFYSYFDKDFYVRVNLNPYNNIPTERYKKQIGDVGQALDNGLGLRAETKLDLLHRFELKKYISKWEDRLDWTSDKYCKKGKTWHE